METISIAIIIIVIMVIVFLITREFWCWYWKINEIKELLKSIDQKLNNNVKDGNNSAEKESSVEIKDEKEKDNNIKKESSTESIPDIKDGYEIIAVDGKKFAVVKNGNPNNFYCPYCYSQVNPKTNSCYKCNHNF